MFEMRVRPPTVIQNLGGTEAAMSRPDATASPAPPPPPEPNATVRAGATSACVGRGDFGPGKRAAAVGAVAAAATTRTTAPKAATKPPQLPVARRGCRRRHLRQRDLRL